MLKSQVLLKHCLGQSEDPKTYSVRYFSYVMSYCSAWISVTSKMWKFKYILEDSVDLMSRCLLIGFQIACRWFDKNTWKHWFQKILTQKLENKHLFEKSCKE